MSFGGLSKSDRDIIAEGKMQERSVDEGRLFGLRNLKESENKNSSLELGFGRRRGRSLSVRRPVNDPKGKKPEKDVILEDLDEKGDPSEKDELKSRWDRPTVSKVSSERKSLLDWCSFDWKPHFSTFLRGVENWSEYKESLLIQLECIGYESGITLTPLDELKFAATIQRTVTPSVGKLVQGMRSGTKMMQLFERTYRQVGELHRDKLWETLNTLRYDGNCPISYVSRFKAAVNEYQASGGQLPSRQVLTMFKHSVKDKAGKWYDLIATIARFHKWELEDIYEDFMSHNFHRVRRHEVHEKLNHPNIKNSLNVQGNSKEDPREKPQKKGPGKNVRCFNCKRSGHYANNCPEKNKDQKRNSHHLNHTSTSSYQPPPPVTDDYCQISNEKFSGTGLVAKVNPGDYEDLISFYDREKYHQKISQEYKNASDSRSKVPNIYFSQQILNLRSGEQNRDRWLFDTGADIDAVNKRDHFREGSVIELGPKQFPIQTGNGVVYAECVGEVWLPLTGPGGKRSLMLLKKGGRIENNQIISPRGEILSYINPERRGFFLWLYDQPEPLKHQTSERVVKHASTVEQIDNPCSKNQSSEVVEFQDAYLACWSNGIFKMSDEVLRKLVLWHRRLCHPSADRLRWTIKNVGKHAF